LSLLLNANVDTKFLHNHRKITKTKKEEFTCCNWSFKSSFSVSNVFICCWYTEIGILVSAEVIVVCLLLSNKCSNSEIFILDSWSERSKD